MKYQCVWAGLLALAVVGISLPTHAAATLVDDTFSSSFLAPGISGNVLANDLELSEGASVSGFTLNGRNYVPGQVAAYRSGQITIESNGDLEYVYELCNSLISNPAAVEGNLLSYSVVDNGQTRQAYVSLECGGGGVVVVNPTPSLSGETFVGEQDTVLRGNILTNEQGLVTTRGISFVYDGVTYTAAELNSGIQLAVGTLRISQDESVDLVDPTPGGEGTLAVISAGEAVFTPNSGYFGVLEVEYYTGSEANKTSSAMLTLQITPQVATQVDTIELSAALDTVTIRDILANDTNLDSLDTVEFDGVTYQIGERVPFAYGSLVFEASGEVEVTLTSLPSEEVVVTLNYQASNTLSGAEQTAALNLVVPAEASEVVATTPEETEEEVMEEEVETAPVSETASPNATGGTLIRTGGVS